MRLPATAGFVAAGANQLSTAIAATAALLTTPRRPRKFNDAVRVVRGLADADVAQPHAIIWRAQYIVLSDFTEGLHGLRPLRSKNKSNQSNNTVLFSSGQFGPFISAGTRAPELLWWPVICKGVCSTKSSARGARSETTLCATLLRRAEHPRLGPPPATVVKHKAAPVTSVRAL